MSWRTISHHSGAISGLVSEIKSYSGRTSSQAERQQVVCGDHMTCTRKYSSNTVQ